MVIPNASACALWNAGGGKTVLYQRATVNANLESACEWAFRPRSTWDGETSRRAVSTENGKAEGDGTMRLDPIEKPNSPSHSRRVESIYELHVPRFALLCYLGLRLWVSPADSFRADEMTTDGCYAE